MIIVIFGDFIEVEVNVYKLCLVYVNLDNIVSYMVNCILV